MVFLINGQIQGDAPQKKYQNPEDVYRKESREEFRKNYPNIEAAKEAQKAAWVVLSDEQKEKYTKLYQDYLKEYENDLDQFNGGSKKVDAGQKEVNQIPPRPKQGLNAYFIYLGKHREEYTKLYPDLKPGEITKELSKQYNLLTMQQIMPYKLEAKKQQETQDKEIEKWEELYGQQLKEEKKKLKDQNKQSSKVSKKELQYQEILSHKQRRKLVPLGEDETKQVDARSRGRPKKQNSQENQRGSMDRPRSVNQQEQQQGQGRGRPKQQQLQKEQNDRRSMTKSPLEDPQVQQEQKDQKRGRPKKQQE